VFKRFVSFTTGFVLLMTLFLLISGGTASAQSAQQSIAAKPLGLAPSSCQTVASQNDGYYDYLLAPNMLGVNQCLVSYTFELVMQGDGNLVMYDKSINSTQQALWATNTVGTGAVRVRMQYDGNLVLYTSSGQAVWASNTNRYSPLCNDGCFLFLGACGNLGIITPSDNYIWAISTDDC
jgi:hypothetical protein